MLLVPIALLVFAIGKAFAITHLNCYVRLHLSLSRITHMHAQRQWLITARSNRRRQPASRLLRDNSKMRLAAM